MYGAEHQDDQTLRGRPNDSGPSRLTSEPDEHLRSKRANDKNKEYRSYLGSEAVDFVVRSI